MNTLQRIDNFINGELQVISDELAMQKANEYLEVLRYEEDLMYEEMYSRYQFDY